MNPDNQQIDARVNPEFVQPDLREVEEEYWHLITERDSHVQVQQGSIDTGSGSDGYGFPTSRSSSCGRHPWNLKILSNNRRSLLRTMGPLMGVTIPTLNVGMLFTTACWYRDPHGLPWIEYHHTGKTLVLKMLAQSWGLGVFHLNLPSVPDLLVFLWASKNFHF